MDGVYFITEVKSENEKILSVMTIFNGAGGQIKKYFISVLNGVPHVAGVVTFDFNYNQNPDLQKRCVQARIQIISATVMDWRRGEASC